MRRSPLQIGGLIAATLLVIIWLLWPTSQSSQGVIIHVAASLRKPVQALADRFTARTGIPCELRAGGSQTLLGQISLTRQGDLFVPADDSYLDMPSAQELIAERFALTTMRAVVGVRADRPITIRTWDDLIADNVRIAQAEPTTAAIGKLTQDALRRTGQWERLLTRTIVRTPTVTDAATAVELETVDAAILWDAVVHQTPKLRSIRLPELDAITAKVVAATLRTSTRPTDAQAFARYLAESSDAAQVWPEYGFTLSSEARR